MPLIQANMEQVPDKKTPVDKGPYLFKVGKPTIQNVKDWGTGQDKVPQEQEVAIPLTVVSGPNGEEVGLNKGKLIFDRIPVSDLTRLNRFMQSCGITKEAMIAAGGIDVEQAEGKTSRAVVKNRTSVDKSTGESNTYDGIKDYLLPTDPNPATNG